MMMRRILLIATLAGPVVLVSACDPNAISTGGSVYYDSMMWNDYYYDRPGYRPGHRPLAGHPGRPVHPIAPAPPRPHPPAARPLPARPPIHRPR